MCSFASVMECLLHLLVLEEQSWSKQATNGISSQISTIETTRRKALLFIFVFLQAWQFLRMQALIKRACANRCGAPTGCGAAGWGFSCCTAANWGESLLGKCMGKTANSLMCLTKSALWVLARGGGCAKWYKGPFASGSWALAEGERGLKSKFGAWGGKCRWRALALLTAFPGIHSTIAHHASASCSVKLMHLCSLPLHEIKGSKAESGKSRKLGLPSLLRFARVYGALSS